MFIPDPGPRSRTWIPKPDPGSKKIPDPDQYQRISVFLTQKLVSQALGKMFWNIPYPGSSFSSNLDPGAKKAPDPGPGSATLILTWPCAYFNAYPGLENDNQTQREEEKVQRGENPAPVRRPTAEQLNLNHRHHLFPSLFPLSMLDHGKSFTLDPEPNPNGSALFAGSRSVSISSDVKIKESWKGKIIIFLLIRIYIHFNQM